MELWTYEHFITVVPAVFVMIVVAFILNHFLANKPHSIRMIPFQILAALLALSEVAKQVISISRGYDLYHLPFHVCSLFIFLIPLMAFYKGKYQYVIRTFTCTVCLALFLFMTIYPNLIYSSGNITNFFNDYFDFHTVFFHNVVLFEFILIIVLNLHSVANKNYLKQVVIGAICYTILAATMSQLLKTNYSNFYSCNIGPIESLVDSIKDSIGYFAAQAIYVIILSLLHVGFFTLSYYLYTLIDKICLKVRNKLAIKKE